MYDGVIRLDSVVMVIQNAQSLIKKYSDVHLTNQITSFMYCGVIRLDSVVMVIQNAHSLIKKYSDVHLTNQITSLIITMYAYSNRHLVNLGMKLANTNITKT